MSENRRDERVPVVIVGAGPAGLVLSHLLHLRGIESVVLEARDRAYVEGRVRAGVLEQGTVDLLTEAGVADRLHAEGLLHHGIELRYEGESHRIDMTELSGGRSITVYGQQEVVKDLIARRLEDGGDIRFEVSDVRIEGHMTDRPAVRFVHDGREEVLECEFVAGCDGFHGVSRPTISAGHLRVFEREYPFAWLGILAEAEPSSEELIYAYHDDGFALHSMRSQNLCRNYIQVDPSADLADWSDDRIWEELQKRLSLDGSPPLNVGPIVERSIAAMRSFVVEPMQEGRLFLAGDSAHIVPPTGAKGMNLAVADVAVLASAFEEFFGSGSEAGLKSYSDTCLRRVWRAQHFSWWMTSMLHHFPDGDPYQQRLQISQLRYTVRSEAAATSLAENYVGLEKV